MSHTGTIAPDTKQEAPSSQETSSSDVLHLLSPIRKQGELLRNLTGTEKTLFQPIPQCSEQLQQQRLSQMPLVSRLGNPAVGCS